MYPNQGPYNGYPQAPKPGMSPLVIVLIVLIFMLVLGGGGCLMCVGLAAIGAANQPDEAGTVTSSSSGSGSGGSGTSNQLEQDLVAKLRLQGIPADKVVCPAQRGKTFNCDLTVGSDTTAMHVSDNGKGFSFDVPDTAFLDGTKLTTTFQTSIGSKAGGNLRVPCFTGILMKHVGSDFACDVFTGVTKAGVVITTVDSARGDVHMTFTGAAVAPNGQTTPTARRGPRVIDFVCPAGQKPGGAVRAGCVCGNQILGTACGPAGNFTEVTETPKGCRFTCAD